MPGAVNEILDGIFQWQEPHPEWKPGEGWDEMVSSYAIDDGEHLLLFDPLGLPGELAQLAADRSVSVLLTCPWHVRDAAQAASRFGAVIHVPRPDEATPTPPGSLVYEAGDRLPGGVQAHLGMESNDLVLWVESRAVLVAGDSLIDRGNGLEVPAEWVKETATREQVLAALRPLLELAVELVLPTHGNPAGMDALRRALV